MAMSMSATETRGWFSPGDCRLEDFRAVVEQTTDLADYPTAESVRSNVLIYGPKLSEQAATEAVALVKSLFRGKSKQDAADGG